MKRHILIFLIVLGTTVCHAQKIETKTLSVSEKSNPATVSTVVIPEVTLQKKVGITVNTQPKTKISLAKNTTVLNAAPAAKQISNVKPISTDASKETILLQKAARPKNTVAKAKKIDH